MSDAADSYPRQHARTRGFQLGAPRSVTVSPDGARVVFLRSGSGSDPVTRLHVLDTATGAQRCLVDPGALAGPEEDLPAEERARRERMREVAGGVTAYAVDREARLAVLALGGVPYAVDLVAGDVRALPAPGPVVDPRPDPAGARVAYASGGGLWVVDVAGGEPVALCAPGEGEDAVTWGLADFVAAEELERQRGFWWLADSSGLLVERVDEAGVATVWIADPSRPDLAPAARRYPAAGTANAAVSLWRVGLDGSRAPVPWDADALPYLATVDAGPHGDPVVSLLSRDQRRQVVLAVDPATGATRPLAERTDPRWVDVVGGVPSRAPGGGLLEVVADAAVDTYRLLLDGEPLTPPGMQVRAVGDAADDGVVVQVAARSADRAHLVRWDGTVEVLPASAPAAGTPAGDAAAGTPGAATPADGPRTGPPGTAQPGPFVGGGVVTARRGGGVLVTASTSVDRTATEVRVLRDLGPAGPVVLTTLESFAEAPLVAPRVELLAAGPDALPAAVLFPTGHAPGSARLPVLLSPYGGPHHREVVEAGRAFGTDQWLADQGFCVVVADGRGTPGRGPAWERRVWRDFTCVLDDQVAALDAVTARWPDDTDPARVGIRGWSFGGWLAALAVLRRPDVFAAAVAGAPVTDWALYDTAYTERYLGHPDADPEVYAANGLVGMAPGLDRPLLLVHGLADDNVVVAHTLRLSAALLAAGRPHSVLPLSGVTHMTPQEVVAENLLRLELDFLRRHLG